MRNTKTCLVIVATVVGLSAQQPPAPPPQISAFFNEFTTEWVRGNPNQAATRAIHRRRTGRLQQQITPETADTGEGAWISRRKPRAAGDVRPRAPVRDRAHLADLMQWQLGLVVEAEKYSDSLPDRAVRCTSAQAEDLSGATARAWVARKPTHSGGHAHHGAAHHGRPRAGQVRRT
jgi:hypothetical protein